jgi:hypothetical protein
VQIEPRASSETCGAPPGITGNADRAAPCRCLVDHKAGREILVFAGILDDQRIMAQPQLDRAAGLGLSTIVDFERKRRAVSPEAIAAIRNALEAAGIEFIDENGGGAGARLRKPSQDKSRKGKR